MASSTTVSADQNNVNENPAMPVSQSFNQQQNANQMSNTTGTQSVTKRDLTSVVWQFFVRKTFVPSNSDNAESASANDDWKSQALCSLCNSTISLGSKVLKTQTTSALLSHLRSKHPTELNEAQLKRKGAQPEGDVQMKQARLDIASTWTSKWPIDSRNAAEVHKVVMDMIIADMQPLAIVTDDGLNINDKRYIIRLVVLDIALLIIAVARLFNLEKID